MSELFDPYHKWLAIPPRDQPPNHYRLLAIDLFETDPDVIANAADQRMAHIKRYQAGQRALLSQKLLREIVTARACLLDPQKKARYDQDLLAARGQVQPAVAVSPVGAAGTAPVDVSSQQATAPQIELSPAQATTGTRARRSAGGSSKASKQRRNVRIFVHVTAPIVGLTLGYVLLCFARPELNIFSGSSDSRRDDREVTTPDTPDTVAQHDRTRRHVRPAHRHDDPGSSGEPKDPTAKNGPATSDATEPKQEPSQQDSVPPKEKSHGTSSGQPDATDDTAPPTKEGQSHIPDVSEVESAEQPLTNDEKVARLQADLGKTLTDYDVRTALDLTAEIAELREQDVAVLQLATMKRFKEEANSEAQHKQLAEVGLQLLEKSAGKAPAKVLRPLANITLFAARAADDVDLERKAVLHMIAIKDQEPEP